MRRVKSLASIERAIVRCRACPRLVEHRERVARERVRRFADWAYWGRAVPGFGDPHARVLIVGLAPAAHGANRTGRIFTGDESGNWLYRALHDAGFANQPTAVDRDDGLELDDVWISAVARCAPPANKPTREELLACRGYLVSELQTLRRLRVIVALGSVAHAGVLEALTVSGVGVPRPRPRFGHGKLHQIGGALTLVDSYHPSQQNTYTGRLTRAMLDDVFRKARRACGGGSLGH